MGTILRRGKFVYELFISNNGLRVVRLYPQKKELLKDWIGSDFLKTVPKPSIKVLSESNIEIPEPIEPVEPAEPVETELEEPEAPVELEEPEEPEEPEASEEPEFDFDPVEDEVDEADEEPLEPPTPEPAPEFDPDPNPEPSIPPVTPPSTSPIPPQIGTPIRVQPGSLNSALNSARGGEIFIAEAGQHGEIVCRRKFNSKVIVQGTTGARITGIRLTGASNIAFRAFELNYNFNNEPNWHRPVLLINCQDIELSGFRSTGSIAQGTGSVIRDGYPTGVAFMMQRSQRIVISNNWIRKWSVGVKADYCSFISILNNDIKNLNHDAIQLGECDNCTVENNDIGEFHWHKADKNHPDGIQFWSNKVPVKWHDNLKIKYNKISNAVGDWSQGILGRQARNVEIIGNDVQVASWNGIQLYESQNFIIDVNVIKKVGDPTAASVKALPANVVPRIDLTRTVGGIGKITNNIAPQIIGIKPGWIVSGNT